MSKHIFTAEYDLIEEDDLLNDFNNYNPSITDITKLYSNLFNSNINIEYLIKETSYVVLKIYDISENKIVELIRNFQITGNYTINWNAKSHSSGMYFLNLKANNNHFTQKIILLK